MKSIAFSLLAFFAICHGAVAQHWAPLRAGHLAHYATNGGTRLADVARTVYTDSLNAVPDTLHLHLNRIVTPCYACPYDTLQDSPQAPNGQWRAALAYQPHFLGRTATALPGGHWWLHGPGAVCIWAEADVGDSWLMDTAANITATITGYDTATVLGQLDSLKTISLSNGGTVGLSRSRGVVQWHIDSLDYRLVGWENELTGQVLGVKWPRFADVFTAQPGDTLYTRFAEAYGDPGAQTETHNCSVIQSIMVSSDTIYTTVETHWEQFNGNGWGWPPYQNGYFTTTLKTPNIRMPFVDGEIFVFEPANWNQHQLFSPVFEYLPGGNQVMYCGSYAQNLNMPGISPAPEQYSYATQYGNDTLRLMELGYEDGYYTSLFHAACPYPVYFYFSGFEHSRLNELQPSTANYICGPVGAPDAAPAPVLNVRAPMGAGYATLQNPTPRTWAATLRDATGRALRTLTLPPNTETRVDLEALPSGVYLLTATDGIYVVSHRVLQP